MAEALWEGGAEATIVEKAWRSEHLPHTIIWPIKELLGPNRLTVLAADQTEIPFSGWVEVEFKLCNTGKKTFLIR